MHLEKTTMDFRWGSHTEGSVHQKAICQDFRSIPAGSNVEPLHGKEGYEHREEGKEKERRGDSIDHHPTNHKQRAEEHLVNVHHYFLHVGGKKKHSRKKFIKCIY